MNGLFITSTGTDTGKTLVASAILHQMFRQNKLVHAIKPIASGMGAVNAVSDAARLLRAMGKPQHVSAVQSICPWQYDAPISPHLAARHEQKPIVWNDLLGFCESEIVSHAFTLVEGAGGLMSPLDDTHTNLNLVMALKLPAVLVASNYLGAISHTFTALEVLMKYNVLLAGVVISAHEFPTVDEAEMRRLLTTKLATHTPILWIDRLADGMDNYKHAPNLEVLWNAPPRS
jgi:dethiobiotin synthetase